jgi:hypothetical protein
MAPPNNLREQIIVPQRSPVWLRGPLGSRFLYMLGAAHDHFAEYIWGGVSQRFPTYAEELSRKALSVDRRIPLFPSEPIPSQQSRLRAWRSTARGAGTTSTMLEQSQAFWLPETPMMRLVYGNSTRALWTTLNPDGSLGFVRREPTNWDWDSAYPFHTEPATLHRWSLIIYAPPSVTPNNPTEDPSDVLSIGSSLTVQQTSDIGKLAEAFSRVGAFMWNWILAFDPASFDPLGGPGAGYPDGTWYQSYKMGGGFNRLETARYHIERAWTP